MKTMTIILMMLMASMANANSIYGKALCKETDKPIESVTVKVGEQVVLTRNDGSFLIKNVADGAHDIEFFRMGYATQKVTLKVPLEKSLIVKLEPQSVLLGNVTVSETRAQERKTPVTFSSMNQEEIKEKNFGQDIPMLLNEMPNVFSYSDAGNAMGYSNLKVRGFPQTRIGVMINGIPLNDPEDHQVYWVDMPDFAESVSSIQFQRGVGSSLYGISSFGGSINLETSIISQPPSIQLYADYGSYKTYKTGFNAIFEPFKKYKAKFRFSKIASDGYRDRSATDLLSYFVSVARIGEKSTLEMVYYNGFEETHAAWDASPESELEQNHQHNPYAYYDEIDNFQQPHYELHHRYLFLENLDMKNTFFNIHGKGFYRQFKEEADLWEYGLTEISDEEADIVREKWVEKDQLGWVANLNWRHSLGELTLGTYTSLFASEHWGEVDSVSVEIPNFQKNFRYHYYTGDKKYATVFLNENFSTVENITLMANLYYQYITYRFQQKEAGNFTGAYLNRYEVDYHFFNPRFGVNVNLDDKWNVYGNISFSQREPTDNELFDTWYGPDDLGIEPLFAEADTVYNAVGEIRYVTWQKPYVKEEELVNYEFGLNYLTGSMEMRLNLFLMDFQNEIVALGGVDDDGTPIRGNADKTIHRGVEFSARKELPLFLSLSGSVSYNDNYFKTFASYEYDENWEPIQTDYSGKKIAGFPDWLAKTTLMFKIHQYQAGLQFFHVGKQYLDNTENSERTVPSYQLLHFYSRIELGKIGIFSNIEFNLRLNNLLDKKYYTAGYFYGENYYWAGAGAHASLGIRLTY
jgi:iron complex outermembrane receptor protein